MAAGAVRAPLRVSGAGRRDRARETTGGGTGRAGFTEVVTTAARSTLRPAARTRGARLSASAGARGAERECVAGAAVATWRALGFSGDARVGFCDVAGLTGSRFAAAAACPERCEPLRDAGAPDCDLPLRAAGPDVPFDFPDA